MIFFLINARFNLTKVVRYSFSFACHIIMIIIQEIVLILQGKRYHCKACMYESSAKVFRLWAANRPHVSQRAYFTL